MEKLLSDLVAIPSQSGHEKEISNYIYGWMESHGVTTYEQAGNVVGYIPGRNKDRCLILSGHMDTVDVGDLHQWETDPFDPVVKEGKLYGLGASDMKAGVAVLMDLTAHYGQNPPECDLWFAFVRGEEVDGSGTQSFIAWFKEQTVTQSYSQTEALIAEPTDANFVEIGHRGNQFVKIAVQSESGHASQPHKIKNPAIRIAGRIIAGLRELEQSWQDNLSHEQLGSPTIGVTGVWAGDLNAPNKIAGEATLQLDVRTTPELHAQTGALLDEFLAKYSDKAKVIECEGSPAGWTDESSALRTIFKTAFPKLDQKIMMGSSDLCFFTDAGIPTVIFGPGENMVAHTTNEYASLGSLGRSHAIIESIVSKYGNS